MIYSEQWPQTELSAGLTDGNFRASGLLSHQFTTVFFFFKADNILNILQEKVFLGGKNTLEFVKKEMPVDKETQTVNTPVASQREMFGGLFQSEILRTSYIFYLTSL